MITFKQKGSVTITLSIILVCVLVLVNIITESARVNIVQAESKTFTGMAGDSVLAGYARQVLDDYGILLVWEDLPIEDQAKQYIQANINMADIEIPGTNFMKTGLLDVCSNHKKYVTDNGGEFFVKQILSYMKYAGVKDAINYLKKNTEKINNNNLKEKEDTSEVTDIVDEKSGELQKIVSDIHDNISDLNDAIDLEELFTEAEILFEEVNGNISSDEKKQKKNRIKLIKKFEIFDGILSERKELTEKTISLIEEYEILKKDIMRNCKGSFEGNDYMEDNLAILKNVKGKIEKNEQLSVSKLPDITPENIATVNYAVENLNEIIELLKNLVIKEVTEEDEKNRSLYETAKALIEDGALSLVVDDVTKISKNTIPDSNLPSKKMSTKKTSLSQIQNKALMVLYIDEKFGNYLSPGKNTALKYEYEYILCGKNNDKENFVDTVQKILLMRNVVNAAYLLTDGQKMTEISAVAVSAATAIGIPFLEPIIKAVLVEAWALAEAVSDVKALLKGKKIAIVKTKQTWKTDLGSLGSESQGDETGLTYENYCQAMLMLEKEECLIYRTMDLIQINICKRYNSHFRMEKCLTKVDFTAKYQTEPMFSAMPWCVALLSSEQQAYRYEIAYNNEY